MTYEADKRSLTYRKESFHALAALVDGLVHYLTDSEAQAELEPMDIEIRRMPSDLGFSLDYLDRCYEFKFRPIYETPRDYTLTTTMRHTSDDSAIFFRKVYLDAEGNVFTNLDRKTPIGCIANRESALALIFEQLADATEKELD